MSKINYKCCAFCAKLETCNHVCDGLTGDDGDPCSEEMQELGCDALTSEEDCFERVGQ